MTEPVAWMHTQLPDVAITHEPSDLKRHPERWTPLYTSPPKREWVGLTPADFEKLEQLYGHQVSNDFAFADIICTTEAKLKERNHD